ncbi:MAG: neutral/alkaline non-lysosomal ceramidase N-terminal domain-containing protein [Chthoniobacterales bacterium]
MNPAPDASAGPVSLSAGVAAGDITPGLGIQLTGYAVREGGAKSVDEPLVLQALVLRDEAGATAVILAADICVIDVEHARRLRAAAASAAGTTEAHVLLNVNHSHSAPGIGSYTAAFPAEQRRLHEGYWTRLLDTTAATVRAAVGRLEPARMASGWGECHGNVNRRQRDPGGDIVLGENPAGPCDRSVGVVRFDDTDGRPLAVLFRYSCHTVTLGPRTNRISPDFVGPARRLIESALGCPGVFLQGCAGNVNPATGIGQDDDASPHVLDDMNRLGQRLGAEVVQVAQTLNTFRRRKEPVFVESVGRYWLFEYAGIAAVPAARIAARTAELTLPLTPFPGRAEVEAERDSWAARLETARQGGQSWQTNPLVRFLHWANLRLEAATSGPNPVEIAFPLQALAIGPLVFCAIPFEAMAETGLALVAALGPDTFVLGFSNGLVSYLPTPEVSREGGMEARLGYKAYLVPSEIPGDWEPRIREFFTGNPTPGNP